MYRQGDVLIVPTDDDVQGAPVPRDNGRVVLAYGEVTGHAHAIAGHGVTMFMDTGSGSGGAAGVAWLKVDKPAEVRHEEHATVALKPGNYKIIRQREFNSGEIRRVAD